MDSSPSPANAFDMGQGRADNYEERLLTVLTAQKSKVVDGNESGGDTFDIACFHASYSLLHFLNDFNAYLAQETADESYAEVFYGRLLERLNGHKCDASKCISAARNARFKTEVCSHDSRFAPSAQIMHLRALDTVHVHCFHSFDRYRMLRSDSNSADDAELALLVHQKAVQYESCLLKDEVATTTHNKFMTMVSDSDEDAVRVGPSTFREEVVEHLIAHKVNRNAIQAFLELVTTHDYDTDAIQIDSHFEHSNIKAAMQAIDADEQPSRPSGCFELIRICVSKYIPAKPFYSFGFRFYYWPFFAEDTPGGQNQQNIIHSKGSDKNVRSWWDRGNKGYTCAHWYIRPKYADLQDEILNNVIHTLPLDEFKVLVSEAEVKLDLNESKSKNAEYLFASVYGIDAGSPLQLNHVLALLLYSNFSDLCYEFSKTYRRLNRQESDEALKARHANFYHFGKYLREFVEVFGEEFAESRYETFYHGINTEMLFKDCFAHICGPMSTTTAKNVAMGTFAKGGGIVVHFERNTELAFFIDSQYYSDFPDEKEKLFLGGFAALPFGNIYRIHDQKHFKASVRVIQLLSRMVRADRNSRPIKQRDVKQLVKLMEQKLDGVEHSIDPYPRDL